MNTSTSAIPRTYNMSAIDIALIALVWCVSALVVNPVGDFPLLDDWWFGRTVNHFIETGDYRPLGGELMTMITNILWGSLFCLPAGFSYTALRLSTLSLSLIGLIGVYVLVRDLQQPRWLALLVTLTLGLNPIYYSLSNTFMTDVPFVAIATWAAVFLARSLKSGSDLQMLAGAALALAATLSRQLGLCIPLAFAVTLLLRPGVTPRIAFRAVIPLILCVGAYLAFKHWLAVTGRTVAFGWPNDAVLQELKNAKELIGLLFVHAFEVLINLGLFLSPVLLFSVKDIIRSHGRRAIVPIAIGTLTIILCGAVTAYYGDAVLFPMREDNLLVKFGLGPVYSRDTMVLHLDNMTPLPAGFWLIVTAMGFVGSASLIATFSAHLPNLIRKVLQRVPIRDTEAVGLLLVLCGILYLLFLLPFPGFFDRYVLLLIPFFAAGIIGITDAFAKIAPYKENLLRLPAFALVAAFGLFALAGTHDYLARNRARWEAFRDLMQHDHISPADIDGGYEFNGLYTFDLNYKGDDSRSWWFVNRDTYQVGFGPVPGYRVIKESSFDRWLPPHVQKVVILRKK